MKDQVILITGANTGIGRVTAETIADHGAHVVLAGRSEERTKPVMDAIAAKHGADKVTFIPLDLGSFDSVRKATQTFLDSGLPLHGLINNAGLAGTKGKTKDGFEIHFGVNHLGHFLFTLPLLPKLAEHDHSRVVVVASQAHYKADALDLSVMQEETKTTTGFPEYCVSKLANVLFSAELSRRLEGTGIHTYSLHPGVVASDIWRKVPGPFRWAMKLFMITNEEGAQTTIHCATSDSVKEETGLYYDKSKSKTPSKLARDEELALELWEKTEEWTGIRWSDISF